MDSAKHLFAEYAPQPIRQIAVSVYSWWKNIKKIAHEKGVIGPDKLYDEMYFENMKSEAQISDARLISESIDNHFEPKSVIDIGCGPGLFLNYFDEKGVEYHGVDGSQEAISSAIVPESNLEHHDLRKAYHAPKTYDLVICFEVAEHIPEEYADKFVNSVAESGNTIVFTAAEPGQSGTFHINEQPQEYWISKFENHGFTYSDSDTNKLVDDIEDVKDMVWIPQNLMVFHR